MENSKPKKIGIKGILILGNDVEIKWLRFVDAHLTFPEEEAIRIVREQHSFFIKDCYATGRINSM